LPHHWGDVACGVFDVTDCLRLQESQPTMHATILRNLGVSLTTKLRTVNQDVSILATQRS
jgi:hypothetical protein